MTENIYIVEYVKSIGDMDFDMVVMFNKTVISESEVVELIQNEEVERDMRVVTMYKEQYVNLVK